LDWWGAKQWKHWFLPPAAIIWTSPNFNRCVEAVSSTSLPNLSTAALDLDPAGRTQALNHRL
jgi:hypothetical protein